MVEQLRFHPQVADDLKAGVGWYDGISANLGNRFRGAIEQGFDSISLFPQSFGIVFENVRAARVKGFPYLLLFEHGTDVIHLQILADLGAIRLKISVCVKEAALGICLEHGSM